MPKNLYVNLDFGIYVNERRSIVMKINKELREAVAASTGISYKLVCEKNEKRLEKQEYILEYLSKKNASIIDVGCASHLKNIKEQMVKGTWLHSRLDRVTNENYGIDINEEAVNVLRKEYGRTDVFLADILVDIEKIKTYIGGKKDFLLLADVMEHVDDPIGFLRKIKEGKIAEKIIITVPNSFHFINMYFAVRKNAEVINSDHRFWFSPFTLLKCCKEAGIDIEEIDFCGFKLKGHTLLRIICKDIMAQTIFAVGKL